MSFGGAIKLTGENEYKKALNQITQSLKEVSAQMKLTSATYDSNDKSAAALTAKSKDLQRQMELQAEKIKTLKAQYADMSEQQQKNAQRHAELKKNYETEKAKLEEIGRTLGTTSAEYKAQKNVVDNLAQEYKKSTAAQDANEKSLSKLRIEILNAETDYKKSEKALDGFNKELEETDDAAKDAKKPLNDTEKEIKDVGDEAEKSGEKVSKFSKLTGGLKALGGALVGVGVAAFGVGKQALAGYAQMEQLIGGVDKLFGTGGKSIEQYAESVGKSVEEVTDEYAALEKAQAQVVANANDAFQTAGMSANTYMETVTNFSASLIAGLNGDTVKAAELADRAIRDMSDNANTFGTDIASIQNAYQGFAKGNFTMLDNLNTMGAFAA